MANPIHTLASLTIAFFALTTVHPAPAAVQDARSVGTRLVHAPVAGSGQSYEVLTSFRSDSRERDQWIDGEKVPGRTNVTRVAVEQTLALHDHFPGGEVLLRREILGLEHALTVTALKGGSESVGRARGQCIDTGREFELRRVAGGTTVWRLLPRRDPADDLQRVTLAQVADQHPQQAVLSTFPHAPLLACLLPTVPVSVGDRWEVTTAGALEALYPAGEMRLTLAHQSGKVPPFGYDWYATPALCMRGDGSSECSAELVRFEERHGRRLAVIAVELSVEVVADLLTHFRRQGMQILRAGSEWSFEGRGELLWDVAASLAVEFTISGEVLQLWDFRWDERTESRQISSGRFTVRVRETPE